MAFKMKGFSGFKNEGPKKEKSMLAAKVKPIDRNPHPDSDTHISAVPTFSDHIEEAKVRRKNKKK
jgi:hypothetical protein